MNPNNIDYQNIQHANHQNFGMEMHQNNQEGNPNIPKAQNNYRKTTSLENISDESQIYAQNSNFNMKAQVSKQNYTENNEICNNNTTKIIKSEQYSDGRGERHSNSMNMNSNKDYISNKNPLKMQASNNMLSTSTNPKDYYQADNQKPTDPKKNSSNNEGPHSSLFIPIENIISTEENLNIGSENQIEKRSIANTIKQNRKPL